VLCCEAFALRASLELLMTSIGVAATTPHVARVVARIVARIVDTSLFITFVVKNVHKFREQKNAKVPCRILLLLGPVAPMTRDASPHVLLSLGELSWQAQSKITSRARTAQG
jgi:hypothetical protein